MNKIIIKEDVMPSTEELLYLYNDVEWHAYTADKINLKKAIDNSLKVVTAWDDEKLVGLIRVVGDGHTIIYIQDILILKSYQEQGIGSKLLKLILKKYKSICQIVLMTEQTEKTVGFYQKNGMAKVDDYNGVAFVKYN
ncbi:Acetyltransferase (GNAT) domain-containing protein [Proteiniborus ethanoligenes]|uniref:Acetyltransferase (GNAT) domain-containing protein n=1 Tax=Proteiniborus ethanoligenes TaxID=415015 RepID=A0A1H3MW55_9FIRM|nr:GNAT family N-acetyltransferase [Proteiniborus ethanoligenes]SDY80199.1 Acetyltransferase (GNAT) domain-containing protein [Proteiniborus ethanoligenes]